MVYIKCEVACLIIVIFMSLRYHAAKHTINLVHRTFSVSMMTLICNLFFNAIYIMTVNSYETAPQYIVTISYKLYSVSLLASLYMFYIHVKFIADGNKILHNRIGLVNQLILSGLLLVDLLIVPVKYGNSEHGMYATGMISTYEHICSLMLISFTIIKIYTRRKELDMRIKGTILVAYVAVISSLLVQHYFKTMTVSALGLTVGIIAFYITLENPDLILLKKMEIEKKKAERERQRAEAASSSKSKVVTIVSHEIRTPMNAIVGMTELLINNEENEKKLKYLTNIKNSADALVIIVNDILDQSKIEAGKMQIVSQPYELRKLAENIKLILENRVGEKPIEIICDIDETLPTFIEGDSVRIRQVLINLMNNSVKFTEKGHIKLTVTVVSRDKTGFDIKFTVSDTGMGIKEEDMEKLFSAFTQVDVEKNHEKEGTGLGLTISSELVKLMGGQIRVESEYGKGTDFFFTIHQGLVAEEQIVEDNKKQVEGEQVDIEGMNVLIVDDTELNLEIVKEILGMVGVKSEAASSGKQALEMIEEYKYDMILTDYYMPEMSGTEFTQRVRDAASDYFRKVPIIAITGDTSEEARSAFNSSGITDYIEKPIDAQRLIEAVKKYAVKI